MEKDKIKKAVVDMLGKVEYNEGKHRYTRESDGKLLAGVTSITGLADIGDKTQMLMSWAGKEAVKALGFYDPIIDDPDIEERQKELAQQLADIKTLEPKDWYELLKKAKGSFRNKSKDALEIGTHIHNWLEQYVKAKIRNTDLPETPEDIKLPIGQFLDWEKENIKEWVLSEALVYDEENEYAGRLDGLAYLKTGELALIDFKAANHISPEYYLQTAGYQKPFENYGIHIDKRIILRLPKTLQLKAYDKKKRSYYWTENKLEAKVVPTSYDFDIETFLSLRQGFKWLGYIKSKK